MPSPFPGMDPYLEHPHRWHGFHTRLVVRIGDALGEVIPQRYYVTVEERTYILDPTDPQRVRLPDVAVVERPAPAERPTAAGSAVGLAEQGLEILVHVPDLLRQRYLEIRDLQDGDRVVTVIELLSPTNKKPGDGRDDYLEKRGAVLASETSLVEIDLLRQGPRMPSMGVPPGLHFGILVSRAHTRPHARLIPFSVRDPLPSFRVPLANDDAEAALDLKPLIDGVYDSGRYEMRIDYAQPAEPPLSKEDSTWADRLLREKGLR
jgi:hypothetical protein